MLLTSIHHAKYGTITLPIADIVAEKVSKLIEEKVGQSFSEYCRERQESATFSKNDYFFVFDDLERCPMPLDEVMGYISNFVEQYEAKVILIGNEEEIEIIFPDCRSSIRSLSILRWNGRSFPIRMLKQGRQWAFHQVRESRLCHWTFSKNGWNW